MNLDLIINSWIAANRQHKRTLIAYTLGIGIAVCVYSLLVPPTYKATSQVIMAGVKARSSLIKDYPTLENFIANQYKIITGDKILNNVMKKLHLGISKNFMVAAPLNTLRGMIKVNYVKGANLISIEVFNENPVLATQIATVLADEYSNAVRTANFLLAEQAFKWLNETKGYNKRIKMYERALYKLTAHYDPESLDNELKQLRTAQEDILGQKGNETFRLRQLKNEIHYIDSMIAAGNIDDLSALFKSDDVMYYLKRKKNEINNQMYDMKRKTPEDPQILSLEKEMEAVKKDVISEAVHQQSAKKVEIRRTARALQMMDKELGINSKKMARLAKIRAQQQALYRQKEIYQELYNKAIEDIKNGNLIIIDVRGLNTPTVDQIPEIAGPNILLNTALGTIGGFILANILVMLRIGLRQRREPGK